jgi:hypothetical protein
VQLSEHFDVPLQMVVKGRPGCKGCVGVGVTDTGCQGLGLGAGGGVGVVM